ncbi:unnamed protein product [Rotaria sp. Silwood2]|nr:unnamed protein product [Rotaria sp. Silwood2]CAF4095602.1 unnamed protein product [Rotaria sp. Silwood2]CAF4510429.1 unnamed protein product [Rotaria sp. Silwood2]
MVVTRYQLYTTKNYKFAAFFKCIGYIASKLSNILFILCIPLCIGLLYHIFVFTDLKLTMPSFSFEFLKSSMGTVTEDETTTENIDEFTITDVISSTIIAPTTTPFEIVVNMNDRMPSYRLATRNGSKPFTGGARATIFEKLQLYDTCKKDTSILVVDVGAKLGDFGLYAAACDCSVYMLEKQSDMIALIQISIAINKFARRPVLLYHNFVNNPDSDPTSLSGSSNYNAADIVAPIKVQNIQLDNIAWPSSIFILKIDFDSVGLDVLRSGQNLFRQKRIRHLILQYDTVANGQGTKETLMHYLQQTLKPKSVFIFRPNEEKLYGPLYYIQLKELANRQNNQQPIVGLFATFGLRTQKKLINAEPYNAATFFA